MTVGVFRQSGSVDPGEWYSIPVAEIIYNFPILNFESQSLVKFTAYHTAGTATPSVTISILTSADVILKTDTLKDYDTGSTRNPSELITEVPANSAKIRVTSNVPCFLHVQVLRYA
jgi:hypothetical protein